MKVDHFSKPSGFKKAWWCGSIKDTMLAIEDKQIVQKRTDGTCSLCKNYANHLSDGYCSEPQCIKGRQLLSLIDNGGHIVIEGLPGIPLQVTFRDNTGTFVTRSISANVPVETPAFTRNPMGVKARCKSKLPGCSPERPPRQAKRK